MFMVYKPNKKLMQSQWDFVISKGLNSNDVFLIL